MVGGAGERVQPQGKAGNGCRWVAPLARDEPARSTAIGEIGSKPPLYPGASALRWLLDRKLCWCAGLVYATACIYDDSGECDAEWTGLDTTTCCPASAPICSELPYPRSTTRSSLCVVFCL